MAGNGVLVETNGYDDDGHLVAHWTPAKGLTQYSFDDNGNLISVAYSSGPNISAGYDSLNRITSMSYAVGASSFGYTNFGVFLGALATETAPWASDTVTHNYANRLPSALTMSQPTGSWTESFAHDDQLRLESVSSPAGTFTYDYSGAGQEVQNLTLPGGNNLAETYDSAGNVLTTALERGSSVLDYSGYAYDQDANRTTTWRTDGAYVNYGYDDIGELTGATGYETNGTLRGNENFGYGYDGAENLAFRTNNTLIQAFTSDNANDLVSVTRNNNLLTVAGNLTNSLSGLSVNGQTGSIYADQTFAVTNGVAPNNGLNTFTTVVTQGSVTLTNTLTQNLPVSASLHYDLNGNLISDGQYGYSYDCANELTQVTATNQWQVQYVYEGFGRRRVRKAYEWVGGTWLESGEVRYIYDGMTVLQERNLQNSPVVTYTRGTDLSGSMQGAGGIGGLLARTDLSGNSYYHSDGNGNVTMLVDSGGNQLAKYLYDPYGNTLGMWGSLALGNTYRFSSKEIDANSGSYYYGYRYYQPNLQRWLNRDPFGERGGINLYGFVKNSPLTAVDKLGLEPGYGNPVSGPNGPVGPSSPYQPNPWPQPPGGGTTIITVPIPDPNDPDNGFIPSNYQYIMDGFSSGDYLYIPVPAPGDPSSLNRHLKSVCGCIKNLTITGHGAGGTQNIGPSQSTGLGTIQVSYPNGQQQVNNIGIFDGVKFCKPCQILLDGCDTATGVDWKVLFNAISQKTGCQVLGNTTLVHPGGSGPLPGPGPFGPSPIGVQ